MAKEDAAEQVKEVLRQVIKYRFWIAVGFAALFAVIAYFMGSGPVQAKATTEKTKIIKAEKDVRGLLGHEQAHRPLQADRRGEDRDRHQGRQQGLEGAVRPPGPAADLARDRPGSVQQVGPQVAGERGRRQASTLAIVDYIIAYPDLCRHGLQDLPPVRLRDRARGSSPRRPRKPCSGRRSSRSRSRPRWARSGRPRSGSGSSARCWRSSPRSTRRPRPRTGIPPSSRRSCPRGRQPGRPGSASRSPRASSSTRPRRSCPRPRRPRPTRGLRRRRRAAADGGMTGMSRAAAVMGRQGTMGGRWAA